MMKLTKKRTSLPSKFIRSSILVFMDIPINKKTGFLENAARLSHLKRIWRVPKGYTFNQYDLDGLPVEELKSKQTKNKNVILQFHGGAYVMRYFDHYRMVAHKYAKISNASVVSVDYHTAPNHVFPEALNDGLKVWDWLISQGFKEKNIIIVGDSAGGNLSLALTLKLRDKGRKLPKALVLMSPLADFSRRGESYDYNSTKDPLFGKKKGKKETKVEQMHHLIRAYVGDNETTNKYLSPVYAEFQDFPPMLIQVGSNELIESDSITVYQKAITEGVDARLTRYYGMFHDFQMLFNLLPESKAAWNEVQDFITEQFRL